MISNRKLATPLGKIEIAQARSQTWFLKFVQKAKNITTAENP
jgi:hypothetical protein